MSPGGGGKAPGGVYIRGEDGDLSQVAGEVYGDPSKSVNIWGANKPATNKVKKGQKLIIPGEAPPIKLSGKEDDDLTVMVDGIQMAVMSAKIVRTMDTGSDGWTAKIAWTPGLDPQVDKATRPYGYPRAAIYIGNTLVVGGCLYEVEPEMTDKGMTKGLVGYSFTADAIDSHMQPPHERNNITLKQLATELCRPLGINAIFETPVGAAFPRVTSEEADTIFSHLSKLAAQRGILVSCTESGDMLFLRAKTDGEPVGTLEEGQGLPIGWKARYDGRKRYYAYKLITAGAKGAVVPSWGSEAVGKVGPSTITEYDYAVPRSRFLTFRADDTTPGQIKDAARWKKNRQFVEALTQTFPVSSWYAPNGKLWAVNTLVVVKSVIMGVPNGFTFLIREVDFELEDNRRTATLHLVPPQAYTGKEIDNVWT